ncbi:hypothetical protein ARTHRO9AX_30267 [Arthrobacter sp. 9AX]|nr:hypothetical protein ARTHRO9AX_30267 [Arthrobacter sp. 9AX]
MLQTFLAHYVPNPNKINILCWNFNGQITLSHLELEIHLLFALDGAHLDFFNLRSTVVRVNYCLADLKYHVDISPFPQTSLSRFRHMTGRQKGPEPRKSAEKRHNRPPPPP